MFPLFVALAVVSGVALIAGLVMFLVFSGKTRKSTVQQAGAEVMAGIGESAPSEDGDGTGTPVAEASVFRGTGVKVTTEASVGYGDVKAALREKRWRDGLPALLAMVGMTGLLVFGCLAWIVRAQEKALAVFFLVVAVVTFARIWSGFARA